MSYRQMEIKPVVPGGPWPCEVAPQLHTGSAVFEHSCRSAYAVFVESDQPVYLSAGRFVGSLEPAPLGVPLLLEAGLNLIVWCCRLIGGFFLSYILPICV
jgi:hypothetical protein